MSRFAPLHGSAPTAAVHVGAGGRGIDAEGIRDIGARRIARAVSAGGRRRGRRDPVHDPSSHGVEPRLAIALALAAAPLDRCGARLREGGAGLAAAGWAAGGADGGCSGAVVGPRGSVGGRVIIGAASALPIAALASLRQVAPVPKRVALLVVAAVLKDVGGAAVKDIWGSAGGTRRCCGIGNGSVVHGVADGAGAVAAEARSATAGALADGAPTPWWPC